MELFSVPALLGIAAASFIGSFITVALGIGGGALMLAALASLMPPAALIPVHGAIQIGSNLFRAGILLGHVYWPPFLAFTIGSVIGAVAGGSIVVNLPPPYVQIGVGAFVIWSVLSKPPAWLSRWPGLTGGISSFLTMFFGATGLFVANFTKSLNLPRQSHVATHASLMTLQHVLKVAIFAILGFAFGPWLGFIVVMVLAGLAGTLAGKLLLNRMTDHGFKRALDVILILVSLRLIWTGVAAL
ncbi:sulfite exporter TauE/SafE family protein [Silicimonas algicola]|nr:sulfite exporter TauE/SafE family protein [Silicimonas algicola]